MSHQSWFTVSPYRPFCCLLHPVDGSRVILKETTSISKWTFHHRKQVISQNNFSPISNNPCQLVKVDMWKAITYHTYTCGECIKRWLICSDQPFPHRYMIIIIKCNSISSLYVSSELTVWLRTVLFPIHWYRFHKSKCRCHLHAALDARHVTLITLEVIIIKWVTYGQEKKHMVSNYTWLWRSNNA